MGNGPDLAPLSFALTGGGQAGVLIIVMWNSVPILWYGVGNSLNIFPGAPCVQKLPYHVRFPFQFPFPSLPLFLFEHSRNSFFAF
jgi:hypothetical protein